MGVFDQIKSLMSLKDKIAFFSMAKNIPPNKLEVKNPTFVEKKEFNESYLEKTPEIVIHQEVGKRAIRKRDRNSKEFILKHREEIIAEGKLNENGPKCGNNNIQNQAKITSSDSSEAISRKHRVPLPNSVKERILKISDLEQNNQPPNHTKRIIQKDNNNDSNMLSKPLNPITKKDDSNPKPNDPNSTTKKDDSIPKPNNSITTKKDDSVHKPNDPLTTKKEDSIPKPNNSITTKKDDSIPKPNNSITTQKDDSIPKPNNTITTKKDDSIAKPNDPLTTKKEDSIPKPNNSITTKKDDSIPKPNDPLTTKKDNSIAKPSSHTVKTSPTPKHNNPATTNKDNTSTIAKKDTNLGANSAIKNNVIAPPNKNEPSKMSFKDKLALYNK